MRALLPILLFAACGRVSFEPLDGTGVDGGNGLDAPVMLDSGLQLWMKFEPGATLVDSVTNFVASCPTCGTPTPGPRGGALSFNGTTDCLTLWDGPAVSSTEFTLALWIYFTGASSTSVFGKAQSSASSPWNSWELWIRTNNLQVEFQTTANNAYNEDIIVAFRRDVWLHVAATFTATDKALYFDGALVGSEDPTDPLVFGTDPVRIGCDIDNGTTPSQFLEGALDDVRYYDRVLSPAEIQALGAL